MGDVAMTIPVLEMLLEQYNTDLSSPKVKITFVSRPFFEPIVENLPNTKFFAVELNGKHKGFFGLLRLFLDLKKQKIDAVADLHNVLRSKVIRLLFFITRTKTMSVDKGRSGKKALVCLSNKQFVQQPTMAEQYTKVFLKLGFCINTEKPLATKKIMLPVKIQNLAGEYPKQKNIKWIGIAPFAQYDSKTYPFDLMQDVINQLSQNKNYILFLFGGGSIEKEKLNLLANNKENIVVIVGKITFREELHLIANLDVMLSMDSGNGHLAAMFGIKVVTLWGATHPYAGFVPFNQPSKNQLTADRQKFPMLPTSVYGNKKIKGYEDTMRTILPKKIVTVVEENLT